MQRWMLKQPVLNLLLLLSYRKIDLYTFLVKLAASMVVEHPPGLGSVGLHGRMTG